LLKLKRYLKPFLGGVLLAAVLLLGQALCDLNLPNLMSDIVNVGIQQHGVEHAAPQAITPTGEKLIRLYMPEGNDTGDPYYYVFDNWYRTVSVFRIDKNGKDLADTYKDPDIWIHAAVAEAASAKLDQSAIDDAFANASWALLLHMQDIAKASGQDMTGGDNSQLMTGIDITRLYQLLPMLEQFPQEQRDIYIEAARDADPMLKEKAGITFASAFMEEAGVNIDGLQTNYILKTGGIMLLIALMGGVATVLVGLICARISAGVAKHLRRDVFGKVTSFSNAEFDKFSTASLITRSTNDVTQIQMFLMIGIRMLIYAPMMAGGGIFMALSKSASMAWIIAAAVVLLLGIIMIVLAVAMPKFKRMQKLVDRLNLVSRENLSGLMVIRAFGTREHETARFAEANEDLTRNSLFINRVFVVVMPIIMLIMNAVTLLVVWVGAHQIEQSQMQIGDMLAFMQYAMQVIFSFMMMSMMLIFIPRASVAAERIDEVLRSEPSVTDPEQPKAFADTSGLVEFNRVSFRYGGAEEDALHDISFTARPGQTTAIIGPTGSGKSTVASLLMRFYDVTGGEIRVDGLDIREISSHDLRQRIGFVPQKGELLSGTVASNLKYGRPDADDADMAAGAAVAQAADFIGEMEGGFDADISQGGTNVSGGQKQRLSIARALVKKPEIFIFDDSFSALDFKTDRALRAALKAYTGESTVILVAQRVSTIMNADQIIVLEDGAVAGIGTHAELLERCPQYYEIASSQLTPAELSGQGGNSHE